MLSTTNNNNNTTKKKEWIRGVNLGGWLMAERFITPYLFAVNSCHLQGDFCGYRDQNSTTSTTTSTTTNHHNICDPSRCSPYRPHRVTDGNADYHPQHDHEYWDYPYDEYTLGLAFQKKASPEIATSYMQRHWETFVTYQDLVALQEAGVTHLRIPLSFWIRQTEAVGDEPWIMGGWKYFVRVANWCRTLQLEIWADLHGAPGSENGFDNAGHYLGKSTCEGWSSSSRHVERTVQSLTDICQGILQDGIADVVTGFGLLNEPFLDCDDDVLHGYYQQAFTIVRSLLGKDTAVFVGDSFGAWKFNDGDFWTDPETHSNTYLDSHPYHVFFERGRSFTPKQHIAYTCRHNRQDAVSCCYDDPPTNQHPSQGISRIMGEWSAAFDTLPTAMAPHIMKTIALTGEAPFWNRTLSSKRKAFLRQFVEAQMVTYEAKTEGVSSGWLFWNFKMEGGAFAEWDFLRGVREGWIPPIPQDRTVASEDLYGSCYDIYNKTPNDYDLIVEEYPDPRTLDWTKYQGWSVDDDFVLQDDPNLPASVRDIYNTRRKNDSNHDESWSWSGILRWLQLILGIVMLVCLRRRCNSKRRQSQGYQEVK